MAQHPWNTTFTWQSHTAASGVVTQAQIDQFDELGYFVVEDLYSPEELAELTRITDEAEDEAIAELRGKPTNVFSSLKMGPLLLLGNWFDKSQRYDRLLRTKRFLESV